MSRFLTGISARILWLTGLSTLARRIGSAQGRFALEFHGVPRRKYPELPREMRPRITATDLDRVLRWLSSRFRFLGVDEFLAGGSPGVLLTFDDGFANNHGVVLPLLRKYQAPAIFFVATQHIGDRGRWLDFVDDSASAAWGGLVAIPDDAARDLYVGMNEQQIRECVDSGLVTIGAHTVSHPRLPTLNDGALETEITASKVRLEQLTSGPVDLFAYPFGDADGRVARAVEASGFRTAFVEEPLPIEPDYMAIPRVGIHQPKAWYLASKLSGLHDRPLTGSITSS